MSEAATFMPFVIGDGVARTVTVHLRPNFGEGKDAHGYRLVGGQQTEIAMVLSEVEHAVRQVMEGRSSRCMGFWLSETLETE